MHDESDFLRKLLENPADDAARLVYADWLDERADPESAAKSQFLRLTVRQLDPARPKDDDATLQKLAAKLDTDWLAVVSRLEVENCGGMRAEVEEVRQLRNVFELVCDQQWDELTVTDDRAVRHCEKCRQNVHYCDTIMTAREHARQGHCVAVDLGIIRRNGDLRPPRERALMGKMLPDQVRQIEARERERLGVDEVSRARERRKREQK